MKQPERSNENPSQSKASTAYRGFDRTARIYAALAALLLIFVFSLSNATGGSSPQTNQPNAWQGEVVLDGIRYSPLTNDKGQTIYVPTIATPEYILKTIEQYKDIIQHNVNEHSNKKPKIETLTIEPNLEQKLTAYLFLAAENDGNAVPKTVEELKKLEEELDYPIIMTYGNFNETKLNGKTYLVPIKIIKPQGYLAGLKIEKPKRGSVCDVEYVIKVRESPEGKETVEVNTKERGLSYTKLAKWYMEHKGVEYLVGTAYDIFKPFKPTKEEIWVHGCVIKDSKDPKKATTYLSAPLMRIYKQWAYTNK